MREKKCALCGETFRPTARNSKYCSIVCAAAAKQYQELKWRSEHPGYRKPKRTKYGAQTYQNQILLERHK